MLEPRTQRLLLRQWRSEDRAPFAALNADPAVMEHFVAPLTRAESDALAARAARELERRGWGLWAVEVVGGGLPDRTHGPVGQPTPGTFVGFVGLQPVPEQLPFAPAVEVGWRLARDAWGHGYATEAARAALAVAHDELGLAEVVSFTAATNERSQAVMRRLGMTRDPAEDFDHPLVPRGDRLERHVLWRTP